MKNILIVFLAVFALGCENGWYTGPAGFAPEDRIEEEVVTPVIDVYCENCTTDEEGNLYYEYSGHNYGIIDFYVSNVDTYTLVGWLSPHEYCVDHWGQEICEPVITSQTYSDEEGYGHQSFYINETFKGETLQLVGYLNEYNWDEIFITIK
tara:strand:- start:176 stop:628 length:453 start_codon:yes stop_codon:yes gene_type:complete